MFTISVGTNARTHGICCIAIGDDAFARGAYQVVVKDKLTIPNNLTKATAVATMQELKEMKLTYQAMVEQKVAPADFGPASAKAIDLFTAALEKHFGKDLNGLLEDIKKETTSSSSATQEKGDVVNEKNA